MNPTSEYNLPNARSYPWGLLLNPDTSARIGRIQHVLFDFDGTLSVLREGWENVMIPLMVEMICGDHSPSPAIWSEVRDYVDYSTGTLTIIQMEWLVEAVRRHGLVRNIKTASEYKALYKHRLLVGVDERVRRLKNGEVTSDDFMIYGARDLLIGLINRGINLYLVSGTDHMDVLQEARHLQIAQYFDGNIFGALDEREAHDKATIIQRILITNKLSGEELLVIGDGPVEIREAVAQGALAFGVASDEIQRRGWNDRKVRRLTQAGADALIPDFSEYQALLHFLFRNSSG